MCRGSVTEQGAAWEDDWEDLEDRDGGSGEQWQRVEECVRGQSGQCWKRDTAPVLFKVKECWGTDR